MSDQIIYHVPMRNENSLWFSLREYKGKKYFSLRVFYPSQEGDKMLPTKKGITLEAGLLKECEKGIRELQEALEKERSSMAK